jgi:hypothetical protein
MSSTVRKLIRIGRVSPRLKRHLDRLPNAWTTLYELAKLKSDQFERLLASDALHPLATWEELKVALGRRDKDRKNGGNHVSLPFRFDLSNLPATRQKAFVDRLRALCREFKVWHPSKACEATIETLVKPPPGVPFGTRRAERVAGAVV